MELLDDVMIISQATGVSKCLNNSWCNVNVVITISTE